MNEAPPSLEEVRRRHPSAFTIPTERFAHPSERTFAELLGLYGIAWEYEPIEFPLSWDDEGTPTTGFRPDFWLPEFDCFVELTTADQRLVTRKNAKVRRFRELYPEVEITIVYQRDFYDLIERHQMSLDSSAA
jgi:hypothetical protein